MKQSFRLLFLVVLCLPLALTACSSKEKTADSPKTIQETADIAPVETLYNDAAQKLDAGNYLEAARLFDDVERQYPYSQWATKAQLMAGYAHYKNLRYDEAIIALERFIELHPADENVSYAWYLKALCFYEQITDVRRDQAMTELALNNLRQVVTRFPESKYAKDAALKIDLTMDHLAGKEMEIGRYYLFRKKYHAAINRFQKVAADYQTTTHVPEALHRLTEAYLALGIPEEARRVASVLGHNFPHSTWYRDSYALLSGNTTTAAPQQKSLYDKTLGKVF